MKAAPPPFTMLQLAQAFSARLRHQLGADLAEVISRNKREVLPSVCHSHDFVDANVTMLEALESLLPPDEASKFRAEWRDVLDRYGQICDAAWGLARQHHFTL